MQAWRTAMFLRCAAILMSLTAAQAKITNAVLTATPADYRGACPAMIKFTGSITVDAPGKVTYIFTRSDGATDTITKTLVFKAAGSKSVSTTWQLGGDMLPYYSGWEAIKATWIPLLLPPKPVRTRPFVSEHAPFVVRCDPQLNSAISAHGDTDWHIDTANEFLFGEDMAGNLTAVNHAPDGWTKRHMHVGLTDTAKYYYDKTRIPTGEDVDPINGIDTAMLFFYAGHGSPTGWDTLGDGATQSNMALANIITNAGRLRYYWQCSCEVFAHGPRVCPGSSWDYACPANFTGGADAYDQRNVFERWGPALTPDLRMACGASTAAYCHEWNVDKVWNDFNNLHMSVAESFIDGFSGAGVVPLCITMGGADITETPLYDTAFTNQPNNSGASYYHIMYPGGNAQQWNPPTLSITIPRQLPKYRVLAPAIPVRLRALRLQGNRTAVTAFPAFMGGQAEVRRDAISGAVYMNSVQRPTASEAPVEQRVYLERASAVVRELGWESGELTTPVVTPLLTASMPVAGSSSDVRRGQQGVLVTYRRQIDANGQKVDVIGEGGEVRVSLSNAGAVTRASRVWRQIQAPSGTVAIKTFEQARDEAVQKLVDPAAYQLDQWRWGYKELSGGVAQEDLEVVFQFAFVPKDKGDLRQHPPQMIEVSGEAK